MKLVDFYWQIISLTVNIHPGCSLLLENRGDISALNSSSLDYPTDILSFIDNTVIDTGLSNHHKMTTTALKASLPKQTPTIIRNRDCKHSSLIQFRNELFTKLNNTNENDRNDE